MFALAHNKVKEIINPHTWKGVWGNWLGFNDIIKSQKDIRLKQPIQNTR